MKLLILGNHTCGNRGDSAILRGLIDSITLQDPTAEVDVMSRYPVSPPGCWTERSCLTRSTNR